MNQLTDQAVAAIKAQHPKGWIPIDLFNQFEVLFRHYMCANNLRAFYRGPRCSNNNKPHSVPSMTRRCDATHVVFGYKNY